MFGRLLGWRWVATRYDKCATTFLSAVALAATQRPDFAAGDDFRVIHKVLQEVVPVLG